MTFQEIINELNNGIYRPIYFLCGEEDYYIDVITNRVESEVLTDDEKAFNQTVLYGNETNVATVADAARRFPMMSERQVVIVKEAQNLKDWDNLTPYLEKPQPATVLLFAHKHKKPDKRKGVFKKLTSQDGDNVAFFESAKLYDNQIPAWINDYIIQSNRKATNRSVLMLAESLGTDLSKISNEVNKLFTLVPAGGTIKEELVESLIGISKEFNNFELIAALINGDVVKANRVVNYFKSNPKNNPLVVTISLLFRYFNNLLTYHYQMKKTPNSSETARVMGLRPMEVRDCQNGAKRFSAGKCAKVIAALRDADMRAKGGAGVTVPDSEILKELVFKILH